MNPNMSPVTVGLKVLIWIENLLQILGKNMWNTQIARLEDIFPQKNQHFV